MKKITKGNSRATILLIKKKKITIRKLSPTANNNFRMCNQYKKINQFKSTFFLVPNIYKKGFQNGHFYYDMEYINGKNFAENFLDCNFDNFENYFKRITNQILMYKETAIHSKFLEMSLFQNKISNIEKFIKKRYKNNLNLNKTFKNIKNNLDLNKLTNIPKSDYHGDFTFENMIYSMNSKFYLIDFDENEFDSYYLDISKLYQDLLGFWFLRNEKFINSDPKYNHIIIFLNFFTKKFNQFLKLNNIKKNPVYELTKFNLLRTIPYIDNISILEYTLDKIQKIKLKNYE